MSHAGVPPVEILDVQADAGGYNLQAAVSTGWPDLRPPKGVIMAVLEQIKQR